MVSDPNTPLYLRAQPGQQATPNQDAQQEHLRQDISSLIHAIGAQPQQSGGAPSPRTQDSSALRRLLGGATVSTDDQGGILIDTPAATVHSYWPVREQHDHIEGLEDDDDEFRAFMARELDNSEGETGRDPLAVFRTPEFRLALSRAREDATGGVNIGVYDADEEDNADEPAENSAAVQTGARDTWVWRLVGGVMIGAVVYTVYKRVVRSGA